VLPLTWELPASIALTWVLAAVLALPVGQGLACLVLRQSFAWPGPALGQSVLGLLSGERHWGGHARRRAHLAGRPAQRGSSRGDPADPPGCRAVLGRTTARRAPRRRPHGWQHHHHRSAGDGAVLPGIDPPSCTPRTGRPATDLVGVIESGGTVYLLGRDDPYASASPLLTAVAEQVLDTALHLGMASPHGRLCPPSLACLDELPSTTPLPTLRTRMANERALGLAFLYAAQTWRQLVICYGEDEARAMFGLTNNILVFGGGKDIEFYKEISELVGTTRVARRSYNLHRGGWGCSIYGDDVPVLRPDEVRQLPDRQALVVAENAKPFIARLSRCIDGKAGRALLRAQVEAGERAGRHRGGQP
jgi:hypothetical protein